MVCKFSEAIMDSRTINYWQYMGAVLYPTIIIGFVAVAYKAYKRQLPKRILAVYIVNIIANLIFTPIQFGMRNLPLASLDILIVLVTIIILIYMLWNRARWIAIMLVPYLIWVSIATVLQLSITVSNT